MKLKIIVTAFALSLAACASTRVVQSIAPPIPEIHDTRIGPWQHRYPNNKQLVGIWIQQFPDCAFEAPRYEGKHPCMVYYIFPDGRQHGFHYAPDGTVESQGWSVAPTWILEQLEVIYRPTTLEALIKSAKANEGSANKSSQPTSGAASSFLNSHLICAPLAAGLCRSAQEAGLSSPSSPVNFWG